MDLFERLNESIGRLTNEIPELANDTDRLGRYSVKFVNNMAKTAKIVSDNKFRNVFKEQEQTLKGVVSALKKQYEYAKDITKIHQNNKSDFKEEEAHLKATRDYYSNLQQHAAAGADVNARVLENLEDQIAKMTMGLELQRQTNDMAYEALPKHLKFIGKYSSALESAGKGFSVVFNLFKSIFDEVSKFMKKIFETAMEMESITGNLAADMGTTTEQARLLAKETGLAATQTLLLNANLEDVVKIQSTFSDMIGKNVLLTKDQLANIVAIGKGTALGIEGATEMAVVYDILGKSTADVKDFIEITTNSLEISGLNSEKILKVFNQLLPKAILFTGSLKGGTSSLMQMTKLAAKFRFDLDSVFDLSEKIFNPEGAIELAAQLKVLGGGFANLADPFRLMYQGQNDIEGLTKSIIEASTASARWNSITGEFEIPPKQLGVLREVANFTGISAENLMKMSLENAKLTQKLTALDRSGLTFTKDMKEYITTIMEFDKTGRAFVNIKDGLNTMTIGVDQLSQSNIASIREQMASAQSLEQAAAARMNLMDKLHAISNSFFTRIATSLNQLLKSDKFNALMDKLTSSANYLINVLGKYVDQLFSPGSKLMSGIDKFITTADTLIDKILTFFNEEEFKNIGKSIIRMITKVLIPVVGGLVADIWNEIKPMIIRSMVGAGVGMLAGGALSLIPGIGPVLSSALMPSLMALGAGIGLNSGVNAVLHDGRIDDPTSAQIQTGKGSVNVQKFAKGDALYAINEKAMGRTNSSTINNNFNMPAVITVRIEGGQSYQIGRDEIIKILATNYQDVANKSSKIADSETNTNQQGKRNPKIPVTPLV